MKEEAQKYIGSVFVFVATIKKNKKKREREIIKNNRNAIKKPKLPLLLHQDIQFGRTASQGEQTGPFVYCDWMPNI